jgi:hypothetical protein
MESAALRRNQQPPASFHRPHSVDRSAGDRDPNRDPATATATPTATATATPTATPTLITSWRLRARHAPGTPAANGVGPGTNYSLRAVALFTGRPRRGEDAP